MKVFLGGTCAGTNWRDKLIEKFDDSNNFINYFNPVVKNWTFEDKMNEYKEKDICDIHLYVITSKMKGVFSIAEAVDSAWRYDKYCIFCVISEGFSGSELMSLNAVGELIEKRGGNWMSGSHFSIDEAVDYIYKICNNKIKGV